MTDNTDRKPNGLLSVAPMLDWTNRDFRYFMRLISPRSLLYSEMITTAALQHGDPARLLDFDAAESPLVLQLGGSDPEALAGCARLGEQWGYAQINLNLGCPSERVRSGRFGACLMADPALVSDCVAAMRESVSIPVTIKHRTGIDDRDSYAELCAFVGSSARAGCHTFIVHARKAWLQGLSPKQNRDVPPLLYDRVYRLKEDFPGLHFIVNGGITSVPAILDHLQHCDGVMLGRAAYHHPWIMAEAETALFGEPPHRDRQGVIEAMLPYIERRLRNGIRLQQITRHMLGLFHGQPGARRWRRYIAEYAHRPGAGPELLLQAAKLRQPPAKL